MTLEDKLKAYAASLGVHPLAADRIDTAFRAGATAMAELFAMGQGLRIEQAPHHYKITYCLQDSLPPQRFLIESIWAYSAKEAADSFSRTHSRYALINVEPDMPDADD